MCVREFFLFNSQKQNIFIWLNGKNKERWTILWKCAIVNQKVETCTAPQKLQLYAQTISRQSNIFTLQKLCMLGGEKRPPTNEANCFTSCLAIWSEACLAE